MRALWMLEELGIDYEPVKTDIMAETDPHREELRTASPMGKVPALVDGELNIADSTKYPEFKGNVAAVYTHPLENTPGSSGGHYVRCACTRTILQHMPCIDC